MCPYDQDKVRRGYDNAAEDYAAQRDLFENERYLRQFASALPEGALVLDVGCGAGVPVDRWLVAQGFRVLGIDISPKQIQLAQDSVPEAHFEFRDMTDLTEGEYVVDGVLSFYAIFHTPRTQHQRLLSTFASYLQPDGVLLITMGTSDWEGTEPDFHGVEMYWSHYAPETNRSLVEAAGFNIQLDEIDYSGEERHQVILAQRTTGPINRGGWK